jgi:hypothetical protein
VWQDSPLSVNTAPLPAIYTRMSSVPGLRVIQEHASPEGSGANALQMVGFDAKFAIRYT